MKKIFFLIFLITVLGSCTRKKNEISPTGTLAKYPAHCYNGLFDASETGIDIEVFKAIQGNDRCESNNNAILSMINDEQSFIDEAIRQDGRGHFMNTYDGCENEETVNGTTYYIYRIN